MKKTFALAMAFILLFVAFGGVAPTSHAEVLTEGDYQYTVTDNEATITGYTGTELDLTVPATLGGYPVVAVGGFINAPCKRVTLPDSVRTLKTRAFGENANLEYLDMGDGVTLIEANCCDYCHNLREVVFSNSLVTIESMAFAQTSLESVSLPASLRTIGVSAFHSCYELTSINFQEGLTTIDVAAFLLNSCTSISLPSTLETIGEAAFSFCDLLTEVNFAGEKPTCGNIAFSTADGVRAAFIEMDYEAFLSHMQSISDEDFYPINFTTNYQYEHMDSWTDNQTNLTDWGPSATERYRLMHIPNVTFNVDEEVIATRYAYPGQTITDIPSVPERIDYVGGWDPDLTGVAITEDCTVNAVYTSIGSVSPDVPGLLTTLGSQAWTVAWDKLRFAFTIDIDTMINMMQVNDFFGFGFYVSRKDAMTGGSWLGENAQGLKLYASENGESIPLGWMEGIEQLTNDEKMAALREAGCQVFSYDDNTFTIALVINNLGTAERQAANIVVRPFFEINGADVDYGSQLYNSIFNIKTYVETGVGGTSTVWPS